MTVIIIHGWGGSPKSDWLPWLKEKLEAHKIKVVVPEMPDTEEPKIMPWVAKLNEAVSKADDELILVGHSIGCQTIIRYLEVSPLKVKGAVFVAGWFKLQNLEAESVDIAKPWVETPIDFAKVRQNLPKSIALFSDNDPYVALENADLFRERLHSDIEIIHNKSHFSEDDGITEASEVLAATKELSK